MRREADATLKMPYAEARLFKRARKFSDGKEEMLCDEMIVQHFTGNEEDVVIYGRGGKRHVGGVRLQMGLTTGAASTFTSFSESVEPLAVEDEIRLLEIYDRLLAQK